MKRIAIFAAIAVIMTLAPAAFASDAMAPPIQQAMEDLGIEKGAPQLCVLTNAPYVAPNGKSCPEVVDTLQDLTGCTVGRKNLLFFQRPVNHPLLVALHREDNGETVVIRHGGKSAKTLRFNMKGDSAAEPAVFGEIKKKLKGDAFSVVTLLTAHAKGAPYSFLKVCEHHNHYCPGVTSGYFIAHFVLDRYPKAAGEKYVWFACPPWCKDDAISTMLDLSPGKQSLFVKNMAEGRATEGPDGRYAGIMVRWNPKTKTGKAAVLQFDWNEAFKLANLTPEEFNPEGGPSNPAFFTARVRSAWALIPHLDEPERFVTLFKEVDVDASGLKRMKQAGEDPYAVIGMAK